MAIKVITAPTVEPVTLAEVKAHLNVDFTDDDALLTTYIKTVTANLAGPRGILDRSLVEQTLELVLDKFPLNEIKLPSGPVQSVTSVKYDDADGIEQTYSSDNYTLDNSRQGDGWLLPVDSWPGTYDAVNAVRVRYVAGYEATSDSPPDYRENVPYPIKTAIKIMVADLYEYRDSVSLGTSQPAQIPSSMTVRALLAPYQNTWFT